MADEILQEEKFLPVKKPKKFSIIHHYIFRGGVWLARDKKGNSVLKCECGALISNTHRKEHLASCGKKLEVACTATDPEETTLPSLTHKRLAPETNENDEAENVDRVFLRITRKRTCKHLRCVRCGRSMLKKNLRQHLRRFPECGKWYYNDGRPLPKLLRLGIGTRWQQSPKYNTEYVVVKREQLVNLEDSFKHLYYLTRTNYYEKLNKEKIRTDVDIDAELCEYEAKKAAFDGAMKLTNEINECFKSEGKADIRFNMLEKKRQLLRQLEDKFCSMYCAFTPPEKYNDPSELLLPECCSIKIDYDIEKLKFILAEQREEARMLNAWISDDKHVPLLVRIENLILSLRPQVVCQRFLLDQISAKAENEQEEARLLFDKKITEMGHTRDCLEKKISEMIKEKSEIENIINDLHIKKKLFGSKELYNTWSECNVAYTALNSELMFLLKMHSKLFSKSCLTVYEFR